ncbi:hypothetical protein BX600DRAFT_436697 [Xylariales sp. PMI_506]|nr:hypothetical protein BX600DRAFT_436697 [Xylariales sp. PMI_506]
MANNHSNGSWAATPTETEEHGLQIRPMGLKIHYTFDKDSQVNCLARWPQILQIQTIPIDEKNTIGVVDLRTCLRAVAQCSPELAGDGERDYTVYAYDYSEPDTPLVGQGMLCWALEHGADASSQQLVTGRVTKNLLAIFGNGIRETLEVKLKLTAVPKVSRGTSAAPGPAVANNSNSFPSTLNKSTSTLSEAAEWTSFIQSHPNLGHSGNVSSVSSPVPQPIRPFSSTYETRNEGMGSKFHSGPMNPASRPGSRPGSVEPSVQANGTLIAPASMPPAVSTAGQPMDWNAAPVGNKGGKAQSRPSSRASSKAPTGRPRGRPRKKPLPVEGNTSGYEDGTDGDDAPPQKKRAKITQVERSNSASFGSAPESLRVAASTAGSLRNFRPIALAGDGPSSSHLQDVPRAPTPVPDRRLPAHPLSHPIPRSNLRRQSTSGSGIDPAGSFNSSFMESTRQSQDARSPVDSLAPSPSQYSEGPSPADIGSSPPVPRSAMYSTRSSPIPSSPILPPMRAGSQFDSGFMSGGFEDSRLDDEDAAKSHRPTSAPAAVKPKPKRSRAKKQQLPYGDNLVIHTETPGPPELLPTTSIYNPPNPQPPIPGRKNSMNVATPTATEQASLPPMQMTTSQESSGLSLTQLERNTTMSPDNGPSQDEIDELEKVLMSSLGDEQGFDVDGMNIQGFTPAAEDGMTPNLSGSQTFERPDRSMEPPPPPRCSEEAAAEPELPLPMVPASDPVLPHLAPMPASETMHPQTDMIGPAEVKYNKNYVKKQAIKQKLDEAIAAGQMPPFCTNCGAIQTPTWRKIWKQEHEGIPAYHEYSDKPGHVTAINVLVRDDDGTVSRYEMIKKTLGPGEDKSAWTEVLLCNPCGIWFSKWKVPRPSEKWEKDHERLGQVRKRRGNGEKAPRSKKPRTKSDSQMLLTSEACLPTDPLGALDGPFSPKDDLMDPFKSGNPSGNGLKGSSMNSKGPGSTHSRASTHSRGSGTPRSPIALDDDLGTTRRLLFPSPRKDGEQKILGEVAVNIVQTAPDFRESKEGEGEAGKENACLTTRDSDDFADLFGTPPRPSTPPPKSTNSGPFKTPTRATPSHRPVTRSVTKSIRSTRSIKSPAQVLSMLQRTPSKTPRSTITSSALRRRSPRHVIGLPSHLLEDSHTLESPFTRSINQLLSEANEFMAPSPNRGFDHLDLGNLPHLESDGHLTHGEHFDFATLLSTDGVMPSSPPMLRHGHLSVSFGAHLTYDDNGPDIWKTLGAAGMDEGGR